MNRRLIIPILVICCGLSGAIGYWFGFREAWNLGVIADFLPRGAISSHQLNALRVGKQENVIIGLESDVDMGLIYGDTLFNHPLRNLLNPVWGFSVYPEYEEYAVRLANYRKKHPTFMKPDMFDKVPQDKPELNDFYKDLQKGVRENIIIINNMTEKYANKQN